MTNLVNPFGWSKRYAAAQQRQANGQFNAEKNRIRHAWIRRQRLDSELASGAITEDSYTMQVLELDEILANAKDPAVVAPAKVDEAARSALVDEAKAKKEEAPAKKRKAEPVFEELPSPDEPATVVE